MKTKVNQEIIKPLARILAHLNQRQFVDVIKETELREFLNQTPDEFSLHRRLYDLYKRYENLDFIRLIGENIRNTQGKFGLPANILAEIDRIDEAITHHMQIVSQRQNPYVFVLLPFRKEFFSIYEKAIRPEFEDLGCEVTHADDDIRGEKLQAPIVNFVLHQIESAAFIVADTTGHNPNVFYELGYAHSKEKTVFIITQDIDADIPFNVRHWHHFFYRPNALNALRTDLRKYAEPLIGRYRDYKTL